MGLLIKEDERGQAEWNRKARDSINALTRLLADSGTTAERPARAVAGQLYYDTTVGKPIWWHVSGVWKDAAGTIV